MFAHFNQRTRAAVSSLAFAALTATTTNTPAEAAQNDAWWLKPDALPATPTLHVREVDVNVRSFTGMVNKERQCEINGTALPVMSGIIPDTGHFYAISLDGKDRHCSFIPLVSIKPQNPATAQELMTTIAAQAPNIAAILQGKSTTGIPQLDQAYLPRHIPNVGVSVPVQTTLSYMLLAGIRQDVQRMGIPIANPCTAGGPDTDSDGIPDIVERQGALDLDGTRFTSDPQKADSDDDGLTDGEEIGGPLDYATAQQRATARGINPASLNPQACYYDVYSNPLLRDTDGDLLEDALELDQDSDPRKPDTDGDGLSDAGEKLWGTDPRKRDTDGDGLADTYELENEAIGYNPLVFNQPLLKQAYLRSVEAGAQAFKGGLCGDVCELNTIPELVGAMAMSVMPVAGTAADVRDVFANTIKGYYVDAAMSATGIIPVGGDATRIGNMAASFLRKHPQQLEPVLQIISKADFIPDKMRASALRRAFTGAAEATFYGLTSRHGISEETLLRLSRNTRNMKTAHLLKVLDECGGCIRRDVAGYSKNGWMEFDIDAEKFFRGNRARPKGLPPIREKRSDIRFYDDLNNGIAYETKSGYVAASNEILDQIKKDCDMLKIGEEFVSRVEWHFFASNTSSSIGAAPPVIQALKGCKNGPIPFYFHIP